MVYYIEIVRLIQLKMAKFQHLHYSIYYSIYTTIFHRDSPDGAAFQIMSIYEPGRALQPTECL